MKTKEQLDYAFKLRRAIVAISERQPSHAKCIIDQFLRLISPQFARGYGVDFPHTCRRACHSDEKSRESGKHPLLYFHVGNAVLAYYDMILDRKDKPFEPAVLDARIKLLEEIAIRGFDNFVPWGGPDGYSLIDTDAARTLREEENARELARFQKENAENEANAVPAETAKPL
jgi:hypothetical protein